MKRIEIEQIVVGTGTPTIIKGAGNAINSSMADMWLEDGMLFIQPKGSREPLRMFHPANIEMRPKDGQIEVRAPQLAAVGGGKK